MINKILSGERGEDRRWGIGFGVGVLAPTPDLYWVHLSLLISSSI
jgi:hypothetical protein